MKLFNSRKKLIAAGISLVAVAGLATGAVAYFTSTGSGTGAATVGTSSDLAISQTNTLGAMYPDAAAQPIDLSINNPGTGTEAVVTVTITIDPTSLPSGCLTSDFAITNATVNDTAVTPGAHPYAGTATGASIQMVDTGLNQDACQGANLVLDFASN